MRHGKLTHMDTFKKYASEPTRISYEVTGLAWLTHAGPKATHVVNVLDHGPTWIQEEYLATVSPTPQSAEAFGRSLAHLHAAGAQYFGAPPPGFSGDGWMGEAPLTLMDHPSYFSWGEFYARERILPYADATVFHPQERQLLERFAEKLASGVYDHPQPFLVTHADDTQGTSTGTNGRVARTHGDLWSGNVMWTQRGVVLIDPAAQGGHAEEDLASLGVFGCPLRDRILAAYNEISPLADGWTERTALHQLHMLMVHCALFGRSYVPGVIEIIRRFL